MEYTTKLKISWKNDLRQSIGEQDVLNLRGQLNIIKCSPDLKMRIQRKEATVREITLK